MSEDRGPASHRPPGDRPEQMGVLNPPTGSTNATERNNPMSEKGAPSYTNLVRERDDMDIRLGRMYDALQEIIDNRPPPPTPIETEANVRIDALEDQIHELFKVGRGLIADEHQGVWDRVRDEVIVRLFPNG